MCFYSQAGAALIHQLLLIWTSRATFDQLSQSFTGFPSWLRKHQKNCNADSNLSLPVSASAHWVHTAACFPWKAFSAIVLGVTMLNLHSWRGAEGVLLFVTQISANDESGLFGSFALTFMWVCKLMPAGLMLEVREETAQFWKGKQLPSAIYSVHEDDVLWGSGSGLKILNYKQMANVP